MSDILPTPIGKRVDSSSELSRHLKRTRNNKGMGILNMTIIVDSSIFAVHHSKMYLLMNFTTTTSMPVKQYFAITLMPAHTLFSLMAESGVLFVIPSYSL